MDYEPEVASDILDYLFLPNFGLNLQMLKVEIGLTQWQRNASHFLLEPQASTLTNYTLRYGGSTPTLPLLPLLPQAHSQDQQRIATTQVYHATPLGWPFLPPLIDTVVTPHRQRLPVR
jgi:hypothetical protein